MFVTRRALVVTGSCEHYVTEAIQRRSSPHRERRESPEIASKPIGATRSSLRGCIAPQS
jgi:hypothetical protein